MSVMATDRDFWAPGPTAGLGDACGSVGIGGTQTIFATATSAEPATSRTTCDPTVTVPLWLGAAVGER